MKMFSDAHGLWLAHGDYRRRDPNRPAARRGDRALKAAARVLPGVKGVEFVFLGQADVVRHNLVQRIIEAYDQNDHPERG